VVPWNGALTDESPILLFTTSNGFEWCFHLDDAEVFKMADVLRDERATTLPAPKTPQ